MTTRVTEAQGSGELEVSTPVHEHDCDACTYITTYPLRYPRFGQYDESDRWITHADIYRTCDPRPNFYKFIVRYGVMGEYATTNQPHVYVLAPWVDGIDDFDETTYREV